MSMMSIVYETFIGLPYILMLYLSSRLYAEVRKRKEMF